MFTLAINTASFTESVALFTDKKNKVAPPKRRIKCLASLRLGLLAEIKWRGAMDESEKLLPAISKLLKRAKKKWNDLKRIIVVNGPGPFSAVRIGVTDANILGFALKIQVFSISSEKLWQLRAPEKNAILLLHAGGNSVAVHENGRKTAIYKISEVPPALAKKCQVFYGDLTADELNELLKNKSCHFIPENKLKSFGETIFNVKLSLLKAGQAKPLYWRPPNITRPKNPTT